MTHTDHSPSLDLCAIIDACAKGGVVKLKFGDIEIDFSPQKIQPVQAKNAVTESPPVFPAQEANGQTPLQTPNAFDKDLLEDLRASQLLIDDPHGFEREQIISQLRSGE